MIRLRWRTPSLLMSYTARSSLMTSPPAGYSARHLQDHSPVNAIVVTNQGRPSAAHLLPPR